MYVAHLALADYRSYTAVDLPLDPGVTTLIGPNGQGKTNLVEAVGYLSSLGSHRVATDAPLVRLGADRAVIRASVQREGRATLLEVEVNPGRANRARVNKAPVPRPREILGALRTVLFAPEDLALVRGDPGERRRYLDDLLVARTPRYAGVRQDYDRILKQRNALLKSAGAKVRSGGGDAATLDVWDEHLARTGAELLAARLDLTRDLRPLVAAAYAAVAPGSGDTAIDYRSSLARGDADGPAGGEELPSDRATLEQLMLAALAGVRRAELERGVSLVGPHRDDLVLRLGPMPAKGYASHGESWSYALALRLAAYDLLVADGQAGGEPVLILDDVFAELDTRRRDRLAGLVSGAEQVLVTAAVPQDVPPALQGARVDVADGRVTRVR